MAVAKVAAADDTPAGEVVTRPLVRDPLSPEGIIEEARRAAVEAEARAAQLEANARNGDRSITPEDLQQAQQHAQWARIQLDAAQVHAGARAEEIRREAWETLKAGHLAEALQDPDGAEIAAAVEQARELVLKVIRLAGAQNAARWQVAKYAADPATYSPPDAELHGYAPNVLPGSSFFDYQGRRYAFKPATSVVRELLQPLKREIEVRSGFVSDDWMNGI